MYGIGSSNQSVPEMASDLIGFEWENDIHQASAVNFWCDLPRLTPEIFPQLSVFSCIWYILCTLDEDPFIYIYNYSYNYI